MGDNDPRSVFRKILGSRNKEIETEINEQKRTQAEEAREVARLSTKFDEEIEPALKKAEETLLSQNPISSILSILEEAAEAIENRENRKMYRPGVRFSVDVLGHHPLIEGFVYKYGESVNKIKARFAKMIEGGKSVNGVITSVHLQLGTADFSQPFLFASITGIKDHVRNGEVNWEIGGTMGNIKFKQFDAHVFADLVATKVSRGEYVRPPRGPDYEL